jgi:hypothetical protein
MRSKFIKRGVPLICALTAALAACDSTSSVSTPSANQAIYDSLGAYDVVPITAPPSSGVVTARDLNDSGVVVGDIRDLNVPATTRAFRWKNGAYEFLSAAGAASSSAMVINSVGDVAGMADVAVVWPAGQTDLVGFVPVDSTSWLRATPRAINAAGRVAIVGGYGSSSTLAVDWPTKTVVGEWRFVSPGGISSSGKLFGGGADGFGSRLQLWQPPNSMHPLCDWFVHGSAIPFAINDSDVIVGDRQSTISGDSDSGPLVVSTSTGCSPSITLDPGFAMTSGDVQLRTINNRNWMGGTIRGAESVMILGWPGYAMLDSVLIRSASASAAWRVKSISKINNVGMMLVTVEGSNGVITPALLVPRKR